MRFFKCQSAVYSSGDAYRSLPEQTVKINILPATIKGRPHGAYQTESQHKRVRLGEEAQQNERALTFEKSRGK